jgi:hypothetical protein
LKENLQNLHFQRSIIQNFHSAILTVNSKLECFNQTKICIIEKKKDLDHSHILYKFLLLIAVDESSGKTNIVKKMSYHKFLRQ